MMVDEESVSNRSSVHARGRTSSFKSITLARRPVQAPATVAHGPARPTGRRERHHQAPTDSCGSGRRSSGVTDGSLTVYNYVAAMPELTTVTVYPATVDILKLSFCAR